MKVRFLASSLVAVLAASAFAASRSARGEQAGPPHLHAGYRGFVLNVPERQMTFLAKDDYVDVLVTFDALMKEGGTEKVTATILQNVRVADLRQPAHPGEDGTIELELNPTEAQYAALSLKQGDVRLLLRGKGDHAMKPLQMASFRKLFK